MNIFDLLKVIKKSHIGYEKSFSFLKNEVLSCTFIHNKVYFREVIC